MRSLLTGFSLFVALGASCGAAAAADYGYAPGDTGGGYTSPVSSSTWAGAYVGAHLGYGFGEVDTADTDGFLVGVQGGYNWQASQIVFGVEADVSYSGVGYSGLADSYDVDWLGTARGRIGYAFDRFMAYGTGGLAWANAEYDSGASTESNTHLGWALGAGVEAMLTERISAKAEYLYTDFRTESYAGIGDIEPDLHSVRLGVNYRF